MNSIGKALGGLFGSGIGIAPPVGTPVGPQVQVEQQKHQNMLNQQMMDNAALTSNPGGLSVLGAQQLGGLSGSHTHSFGGLGQNAFGGLGQNQFGGYAVPSPAPLVITAKEHLKHEAFNMSISAACNLWVAKYSTEFVNAAELAVSAVMNDENLLFMHLLAIRLTHANKMEHMNVGGVPFVRIPPE